MRKCNLLYAHKKSTALLTTIFMKPTNTKQYYETVFRTKFLQIGKQIWTVGKEIILRH
jgi:hypothetical protein